MTLADVNRQFAYWKYHPPAGALIGIIAQFIGWKPLKKPDPGDFDQLFAMFPDGVIK